MVAEFYTKYYLAAVEGLPKYVVLRETLRNAINNGYWKQGDKLPPETEIARLTPFSLGTVQKALKELTLDGTVERHQGQGTFVAEKKNQMHDIWHFRFCDTEAEFFLPAFPKILFIKRLKAKGKWVNALNPENNQVIQIDRTINIGNIFSIYSKFFLPAKRFEAFLTMPKEKLEPVNFKTILHEKFNISIINLTHTVQMAALPKEVCKAINVPVATQGLLVEIMAYSTLPSAIYYQQIFIPPNSMKLYISDSTSIPKCWQ